MRHNSIAGLALAFQLTAAWLHAAVTYDREREALHVTDCLRSVPCTLRALWQADRMNGWGKVAYDAAHDTYTISADLWIGSHDGTETFFQIGSAQHPRETAVVRGHVVVSPFYVPDAGPRRDWRSGKGPICRLTIGVEGNPAITPALKIHSEPGNEHTLYVGKTPASVTGFERGGELHVYHGTITAAVPDKDHMIGAPGPTRLVYLSGRIVLKHATLSWMAGNMSYGLRNAVIEDTTFEHGGAAILGRKHSPKRCTFRHLQTAILDYGDLDITLTDCVFTKNLRNWSVRFTGRGLTCIDCTYDAPKRPNEYRSYQHPKTKRTRYPWFASRRHIVVQVVDAEGKPIQGAQVRVGCEQGLPEAVTNGDQRTDQAGKTPGRGDDGAILLTEVIKRATDTPYKPVVTICSYEIRVIAPGFAETVLTNVRPTRSWQVLLVVMRQEGGR